MPVTSIPARVLQLIESFSTKRVGLIVGTVHQDAIDRTLSFLPEADRKTLKDAQVRIDEDQSEAASPRHAMRSPSQTVEAARAAANDFVRQEIEAARKLEGIGSHDEAMQRLGNAMHTLQDATSPAHHGFQLWRDEYNHSKEGLGHVLKENYDPGPNSALDRVTRTVYDYFTGAQPMPEDFFARVGTAEPPRPTDEERRVRQTGTGRRW